MQAEGGAKFGLPLQNVSCPLAVELVDLFNDSVEVVSAEIYSGVNRRGRDVHCIVGVLGKSSHTL